MSQNIIDLSWDLQKFDAQTQIVLKQMTEVYTSAKGISELKIAPGSTGGYTELIGKTNELNKLHSQTIVLQTKQEQLDQARLRTAKLKADADAAQLKATKAQIAADEALEKQKLRVAAANEKAAKNNVSGVPFVYTAPDTTELKNAKTLVNEVDLAEANAAVSATEFGNSVNKSTTALQTQGTQVKSNAADLAREAQIKKTLSQQDSQNLKNSVREQIAAKGSIEQRRAALIRLSAAYDNLNAAERNSTYGQRLQTVVAGVTTQLKELEGATGRAQRNVGNYASGFSRLNKQFSNFTNLGSLAATALSRLRRQFVGFFVTGFVSGMIIPLIQAFTDWAQSIDLTSDALKRIKEKMANYNEMYEEANKNAGKEITDLKLLYEGTQDLNLSLSDRIKAAKKLQDTYPDTFKNFTAEQIMLGEAAKGYDQLAASILKTALASAARTKIEALAGQKLDIDFQKQKIEDQLTRANLSAKTYSVNSGGSSATMGVGGKTTVITRDAQIAGNNYEAQKQLAEQDKKAADLDQQIQFLTDFIGKEGLIKSLLTKTKKTKGGTGIASSTMESTKESLDLQYELYKIAQQRKINLLSKEEADTKKSLMERVQLAENYRDAVIDLAKKTTEHEIKLDDDKITTLKDNQAKLLSDYEKSAKKLKTEDQKKAAASNYKTKNDNLQIEIDNTNKQIKIAEAKLNDQRLSAADDFNKKYLEITKDEEAKRLAAIEAGEKAIKNVRDEQQSAIDAREASELAGIDKLLSEKIISQEDYNKRKAKLENDALILSLQSQITEEKGLRNIAKLKGDSTIEFDNKITSLTSKLQTAQGKKLPTGEPDELDKRKEIVKDAQLVMSTIDSLVDIGYQKEIDAIQKIIDLNNYRKDQEIAAINASTLSQQEKAAQMIVLDNTVAANNRKLEREKVAIQIKQAKFDRDAAVLQILGNVAAANFKLIAEGGFAGIALGVSVGLEAIAAIATLMAKPLPQMPAYAKGTTNHPGGPAIVGEEYKPELVEEPSGKSFVVSRPMLMHALPKGSKVTPLSSRKEGIMQDLYRSMVIATANMIQEKNSEAAIVDTLNKIDDAIKEGSLATVRAMRKQKGTRVNVYVDSNFGAYIRKNVLE